jgi:hypothetical protein
VRVDKHNTVAFVRSAQLSACRRRREDENKILLASCRIDADQPAERDLESGLVAHLTDNCLPRRLCPLDATTGVHPLVTFPPARQEHLAAVVLDHHTATEKRFLLTDSAPPLLAGGGRSAAISCAFDISEQPEMPAACARRYDSCLVSCARSSDVVSPECAAAVSAPVAGAIPDGWWAAPSFAR